MSRFIPKAAVEREKEKQEAYKISPRPMVQYMGLWMTPAEKKWTKEQYERLNRVGRELLKK